MIEGMKRVLGVVSRDEIREMVAQEFGIRAGEKFNIRKMIGEAIEDLLEGSLDVEISYHYQWSANTKSKFMAALENASRETAYQIALNTVNNAVGTEKFIDDVVERIQKKQVK